MTISACIIAKNEEALLENCLKSVQPLVDEIIFVDTGSTDNTVSIAKKYMAKVFFKAFNNNFSELRNFALENATKDWILIIDCDEYLTVDSLSTLVNFLEEKNLVACSFKLINIIDNTEYDGPFLLRFFKNHEGFHYEGALHEQILPSIYKKYKQSKFTLSDINIYHKGYDLDKDTMKKKHLRNIEILKSYSQDKRDGFYYYNYANEYFSSSNFEEAIKYYKLALSKPNNENDFKSFIPANLLQCFFELKRYEEGIDLATILEDEFFFIRDIYFLKGSLLRKRGKTIEARKCFEKYLLLSDEPLLGSDKHFDKLNDIHSIIKNLT